MTRLFVDCDGTLVLPSGDEPSYPVGNTKLVETLIEKVNADESIELFIWSGGGKAYAAFWGHRLLPALPWKAINKDMQLPEYDDLCIDDAQLTVACNVVTWEEYCAADSSQSGKA